MLRPPEERPRGRAEGANRNRLDSIFILTCGFRVSGVGVCVCVCVLCVRTHISGSGR
jgi:hypothetical protein